MKQLPDISNNIFWDVDFNHSSETEFDQYSSFIMGKVLEYGSLDDIRKIVAYYGKIRIKKEVVRLDLKNKTIAFCCALFNLKKTDFACYTKRQSNPVRWNY